MQKPERSAYTAVDFLGWRDSETLEISPRFQRREVWSRAAQSYLIDTLIIGFPVPPIYMRIVNKAGEDGTSKFIREVVDGQQRITALLDFIGGAYPLSRNIESEYVGHYFEDLPQSLQDSVRYYPFITEVFYGLTDEDVLSIFARLNTNAVRLNAQELRNGKYFGHFKRTCYGLALSHLEFWRANRIFTEQAIARMQEVQLTSELLILLMDGQQDKKKSIDAFYEENDERFTGRKKLEDQFRAVIDEINLCLDDILDNSEFRRVPLFYSLFGVVAHRMFGLPNVKIARPKKGAITQRERNKLRDGVVALSEAVLDARRDELINRRYEQFITASLSQTDNIKPRAARFETLYRLAFA